MEKIQELQAKYLASFDGTEAYVRKTPFGFYVEVYIFNRSSWELISGDAAFRKKFDALMLPWVYKHQALRHKWFRGFLFTVFDGSDSQTAKEASKEEVELLRSLERDLGAQLIHVQHNVQQVRSRDSVEDTGDSQPAL